MSAPGVGNASFYPPPYTFINKQYSPFTLPLSGGTSSPARSRHPDARRHVCTACGDSYRTAPENLLRRTYNKLHAVGRPFTGCRRYPDAVGRPFTGCRRYPDAVGTSFAGRERYPDAVGLPFAGKDRYADGGGQSFAGCSTSGAGRRYTGNTLFAFSGRILITENIQS
jgi:hypothetical protein